MVSHSRRFRGPELNPELWIILRELSFVKCSNQRGRILYQSPVVMLAGCGDARPESVREPFPSQHTCRRHAAIRVKAPEASYTAGARSMEARLSGPLNRLNAILSLLQPLDRYRGPSAIGSAIGRPSLALSRFCAQLGVLNRPVLNRLGGSTAR